MTPERFDELFPRGEETFFLIADMQAWEAFCDANGEAIVESGGFDVAFRLALNCNLLIGGGASPLFRVGFVDF